MPDAFNRDDTVNSEDALSKIMADIIICISPNLKKNSTDFYKADSILHRGWI